MTHTVLNLGALATACFLASVVGTTFVRRLAGRYGWVVLPREDRWHKTATALHGGFGFYPVFFICAVWIIVQQLSVQGFSWESRAAVSQEIVLAVALLLGSLLMFLFGLWDDVRHLRPATKLLGQFVAASLFIYAGGIFPITGIYVFDLLITYFWFIGIINAVNMLDNMDGLASGVVSIAGTTLVVLAMLAHGVALDGVLAVPLGFAFISALLGFWVHNRPPASIFMGDSGSLSIGYILAALSVPSPLNGFLGITEGETVLGPVLVLLIPATVLAIPIFDTTLVTCTRLWKAQKTSQGGRDHSSHRLVGLGLSEKKAVWVLYALAVFGGVVAILLQQFPSQSLPLLGGFSLILVLTGVYLGYVKVHTRATQTNKINQNISPSSWTPLVSHILYKRHAAALIFDAMIVVVSFYGAYLLRFDGVLSPELAQAMATALPLVVSSCLLAFYFAGIYSGQWRLFSVSELPSYAVGVVGGTALSLATVAFLTRFTSAHSRSVYAIFCILLFLAMIGSRLSFRILDVLVLQQGAGKPQTDQKLVLIYGAGKAGKLLHDEMIFNPQMKEYRVIGFIDDDPYRAGRKLCGVPVMSTEDCTRRSWPRPPEVWVSSRFITDRQAQQLASHWNGTGAVRRLQLLMEPVSDAGNEQSLPVCPPSRKDALLRLNAVSTGENP